MTYFSQSDQERKSLRLGWNGGRTGRRRRTAEETGGAASSGHGVGRGGGAAVYPEARRRHRDSKVTGWPRAMASPQVAEDPPPGLPYLQPELSHRAPGVRGLEQ